MLQRIAIPDLTGGVSRQPDSQRFPNQVEESDNTFIHFSQGLEKRAGIEMVKDLGDWTTVQSIQTHWINRSPTERYVVMFRQNASTPLRIDTIDGIACTINYDPGTTAALKSYLNTDPSNIRAITIDDTTIVLNKSITTAVTSTPATYQFGGTNVDESANAHNKASWEEFDLPPTGASEYWYARDDALGHPAGTYQVVSLTAQPWYQRVRTREAGSVFNADTMPIKIVQTGATTFSVSQISWAPRYSGDSLTNPSPSFIGKKITDMCLHRNRLWFSAGESIIGSQSGDFYNFWLDSYASVVDSDPIDVKLGSAQVSSITWMMAFQRQILVFTNAGQQYEIRAEEAMTPTTVSIVPSTTYASPDTRPVIVGSQLYWCAPKGPYSQVYEYIADDSTAQSVAMDAAAHVDRYIPSTIVEMRASASNDVLVLRSGNDLYLNYMYWQGDKKLQNAWCRWPLDHVTTVIGMTILDDYLYMLVRNVTGVKTNLRIDRVRLRHADPVYPDYNPRMDNLHLASGGVWDGVARTTTFTIPFNVSNIDTLFLGTEWAGPPNQTGTRTSIVSCTPDAGGTTDIVVNGKYDTNDVYLGTSFDMSVQLSRQYVRDQNGTPAVGTNQLKQCTVYHRYTGYFTFEIDPKTDPSSVRVWKYTGKQLGSIGFITNTNVISENDSQNFKIMASSGGVALYIRSDSPAPVNITGLEFAVDFVVSKRSAASN